MSAEALELTPAGRGAVPVPPGDLPLERMLAGVVVEGALHGSCDGASFELEMDERVVAVSFPEPADAARLFVRGAAMYRRSRTVRRLLSTTPPWAISVGGRPIVVPGSRRPRHLGTVLAVVFAIAGELVARRSVG